ncbi:MAG: hypothetical protein K0R29_169 [Pseudobdellovibrio sp.]|nr:hypothetical protein [Pseudobdellovibrio sp.]
MEFTACPWASVGQMPVYFCETNLCAWVEQPANTWSNIGYLISAILIFRQTSWRPQRLWFAWIVFILFIGSTFFHMSATVIGRDMDLAGMLLLSSYSLSFTLTRSYKFSTKQMYSIFALLFLTSVPFIHPQLGGTVFLIQFLVAAALEFIYSSKHPPAPMIKKSLVMAFGLFLFALFLNILDMNLIYCLPKNNVITLHAIWHLICAYCIYLLVKYYCHPDSEIKTAV